MRICQVNSVVSSFRLNLRCVMGTYLLGRLPPFDANLFDLTAMTMLKNIPPMLSPELLAVLAEMGHGDELVLADGNFPAEANAQRIVRADGHSAAALLQAILVLLPLDDFVAAPAVVMQVVGKPDETVPIWGVYETIMQEAEGRPIELERVERYAFYDRAQQAYAIVATSETALYGNLILKKGVIKP